MTVVGVSGSPIVDGNTDRMVKALLKQSGKDHIFMNLSTLKYDPCRACVHLCAGTNLCPLEDDLRPYFEPVRDAEALVLGTPIHAGLITGWMYSFTTRLSCFSHITHPLEGKPVLLVAVGGFESTEWMAVSKFGENVIRRANGVKIIGPVNLPATMPYHASMMFSKNLVTFVMEMVNKEDGTLNLDWENEVIAGVCVTHENEIRHEPTNEALA